MIGYTKFDFFGHCIQDYKGLQKQLYEQLTREVIEKEHKNQFIEKWQMLRLVQLYRESLMQAR